ncbi:Extensin family protein [Hyphomicrobium denitrificans 1NES1]|uniref:Extensin family protein n=1 Tax=Hyphomicrobium denitrificans 1NES1 TaxID=670307 RepID=N0BD53_9HYPH|nr:Extensin family protein [Hyphomicrobium denitrificans 1NES1]
MELILSARHEVLMRARALQTLAIARAVRFLIRTSTNLSRAVFIGLVVLVVLHAYLIKREPAPPSIEIVRTHPFASPETPAQQSHPPSGPENTKTEQAPSPSQPADQKTPAPLPPALQKAPAWTESEIADAKAECARLLDKMTVVTEPLPPAREGTCGAPAPRELQSIGESKVKFQPPATLRCPMIAALNTWVSDKLQPAAKRSFGSPIVRILAGSYSCRNRYGLARAPISEHALMNAIDISGFVLENGKIVRVSRSWTAHNDEESRDAPKAGVAHMRAKTVTVVAVRVGAPNSVAHGADDSSKTKPDDAKKPEKDATSEFLHVAHDEACKIFGTVLGPDANAAHHDHFHLDMKERKYRSICQ